MSADILQMWKKECMLNIKILGICYYFWPKAAKIQTLQTLPGINFNEKKLLDHHRPSAACHSSFITGSIIIICFCALKACPVQWKLLEVFTVGVTDVTSRSRQPGNICHLSRQSGWELSICVHVIDSWRNTGESYVWYKLGSHKIL